MSFLTRLNTMRVGDTLESPTRFRVDFIQPDDSEITCFAVSYRDSLLYLSGNRSTAAKLHLANWLDDAAWFRARGMPYPHGDAKWYQHRGLAVPARNDPRDPDYGQWVFTNAATIDLWNMRLRSLSVVDPQNLFVPSPHTGEMRTQITLPRLDVTAGDQPAMHESELNGDQVQRVATRRQRGDAVTLDTQFECGGLYALKELPQGGAKKARTRFGYVRLLDIRPAEIGTLTEDDLLDEGYDSWAQWAQAWKAAKHGEFRDSRPVWVLRFTRIHSPLVTPFPRWPTPAMEPVAIIKRQLMWAWEV